MLVCNLLCDIDILYVYQYYVIHVHKYQMDHIHYSFAPLILFRISYMLDFLPYYLSIENGTVGIGIFELLVFQCFV